MKRVSISEETYLNTLATLGKIEQGELCKDVIDRAFTRARCRELADSLRAESAPVHQLGPEPIR